MHDDPAGLIDAWLDSNVNSSHMISNLVKVMLDHSGLPRQIPSVDRLVKQFYEEECRILSGAIGRGSRSVCSNRSMSGDWRVRIQPFGRRDGCRQIRPGFDLAQAIEDLRNILLQQSWATSMESLAAWQREPTLARIPTRRF